MGVLQTDGDRREHRYEGHRAAGGDFGFVLDSLHDGGVRENMPPPPLSETVSRHARHPTVPIVIYH